MSIDIIGEQGRSGRMAWARKSPSAVVVVAVIAAAALIVHLITPLTADVSWLITASERVLAGQRLYVDILEPNPPMSVWIYLPWAWLANAAGVRPEAIIALATVCFALVAVWASARTIAASGFAEERARWPVVAALALIAAPLETFAQREHFAVIAALPLLAILAGRAQGRSPDWAEAAFAGSCAALAMAIKPFFALSFLLPALFVAYRARSLRPLLGAEVLFASVGVAAFVSAVFALHPEYVSQMLPIVAEVYAPSRLPLGELLTKGCVLALGLGLATLVVGGRDLLARPLFATFGLAIAGFAAAYFIQAHGWAYHLMPAAVLTLLLLGLAISWPGTRMTVGLAAGAIAIVGAEAGEFAVTRARTDAVAGALAPLGPGLKIGLVSADLANGSPLHRMLGATLVNRAPSSWIAGNAAPLCRAPAPERPAMCAWALDRDRVILTEDFKRTPPDVIVGESDRVMAWARQNPQLAEILDRYAPVHLAGDKILPVKLFVRKTSVD